MAKRLVILVSGVVQGVFYRSAALKMAKELNLAGFVKNEPDGNVAIVVEGEEEKLKELIEWTKKGSILAKVSNIEVKWDKAQGEFTNFEIKY